MTSHRRHLPLRLAIATTLAAVLPEIVPTASAQDVRAYATADSVSVGERFNLVVVAERPVWARTVFPVPPPDTAGELLHAGDILLLRLIDDTSIRPADDSEVDSVLYEATTFALDTALVGPIPVGIVSNADTFTAVTDPFLIPVRSVVPPDADDILDLMPIAEFPQAVWPWVVFVALLILATALFLFWYRRSPQIIELLRDERSVSKSPLEEALERLDRLERASLETDTARKAFFVELSETVRTYLARRLHIPALERTSREMIEDLNHLSERNDVPSEMVPEAERLLETSDLAKFAEIYPPEVECRSSLPQTRKLIEGVEEFLTPRTGPVEIEPDDIVEQDTVSEKI